MSTDPVSPRRRKEIVEALRRGTVPLNGLDVLAVGLGRFTAAVNDDLARVAGGGSAFKAVRGEYGAGKTFFARWLGERAKRSGFAVSEVQISETETPMHRMETVYRRLTERMTTEQFPASALRPVLDAWIFALEEDVLAAGGVAEHDAEGMQRAVSELMERRLTSVSRDAPGFATALRGYRQAMAAGQIDVAEGLAAWLGGQPHVAAGLRRHAGVKGDLDHFGALSFLQGLLAVSRDSGHAGLVVILDEAETLQRIRSDARDKALNALRQLVDDVHSGRFPGLYLLITGTAAFYDGPQGVQRLPPLAQRLATDFGDDPRWDNPRAVQLRLPAFTVETLVELGSKVRNLFENPRVATAVDDAYLRDLAEAVAGRLGGRVGVAPRLYLKKLVADVLDRVDQFDDWDPRQHYALTLRHDELTNVERNAITASAPAATTTPVSAGEIELP